MNYFIVKIPIPDPWDPDTVFYQSLYIQGEDDNLTLEDIKNVCERKFAEERASFAKEEAANLVSAPYYTWEAALNTLATVENKVFLCYGLVHTSTFTTVCSRRECLSMAKIEFDDKERRHAPRE